MNDLRPLDEQIKEASDNYSAAVRRLASELAPLKNLASFKKFLDLIRQDKEATTARRKAMVPDLNNAPVWIACSAVEDYIDELIGRVDEALTAAKNLDTPDDEPGE